MQLDSLSAAPLSDADFDDLMKELGPFEPCPHLAVGVSGGRDSLALVLLADRWARAQGGRVSALCVDHGLRAESCREAAQVDDWLKERHIPCHVLRWEGNKPRSGIQEAARNARFSLMREWCRTRGVLHLLLAHHQEDQAETFLMRVRGKSGIDGLAAMGLLAEEAKVRLLRPLLGVSRLRLEGILKKAGQNWLDDPSNENERFGRVEVRKRLPDLVSIGLDSDVFCRAASQAGKVRMERMREEAALCGEAVRLSSAGFACCTLSLMAEHRRGAALLSRIIAVVSGETAYAPDEKRVETLLRDVAYGREGTKNLGGCLLIPAYRKDRLWIGREIRGEGPEAVDIDGTGKAVWDNRFHFLIEGKSISGLQVRATGEKGLALLSRERGKEIPSTGSRNRNIWPFAIRRALPALWQGQTLVAIPHLFYDNRKMRERIGIERVSVRFSPKMSVTRHARYLVYG